MINPAYVGVHDIAMGMISTRGQWIGIEGAPWTHTLSLSSAITDQMGVGVLVINDRYGINNNVEGILAYSYKIKWYDKSLSFGLQGGMAQHRLDYSSLNLEIHDPNIPITNTKFNVKNFGTGVFFMNRRFYAGLSVPRIIRTNLASDNARETLYKRHYYLSTGYVFDYIDFIKIKPSVLIRHADGERVSIQLNGQVIISDRFWAGISLRNLDMGGFNFQYIEDGVRIGYGFELPISQLATASYGIHELMFSIDARLIKKQQVKDRYF